MQEQLLHALSIGVTRDTLTVLARLAGGAASDADLLINAVTPALCRERATPRSAEVFGRGPAAECIARELAAHRITSVDSRLPVAVLVAEHLIPPSNYQRWLSCDRPHLPVIFSDAMVTIGPIIHPGQTGCLHCDFRHRHDADPSWPALASQLLAHPAAATTDPVLALEAAAQVVRLLHDAEVKETQIVSSASALRIDEDGSRELLPRPLHPECLCSDLTKTSTPPPAAPTRRETVTAAAPNDAAPPATTTTAGAA